MLGDGSYSKEDPADFCQAYGTVDCPLSLIRSVFNPIRLYEPVNTGGGMIWILHGYNKWLWWTVLK